MLDDFEIQLVCEKLELGASLEVSARAVGLVPAELIGYLQVARDPTHPGHKHRSQIMRAMAQSEITDLEKLHNSTDWRAAAWRLSRRWPKRWGDKVSVDVAIGAKQDGGNPWAATLKPPDLGPLLGTNKNQGALPAPGEEYEGSSQVIEGEILED